LQDYCGYLGGRTGIFNRREANLQVLRPAIETETPSSTHLTDLRFADLPLSAALQQSIAEAGFVQCTPIQSKTLPIAIDGQGGRP
jgi:superfamily II DNA/RNA helicase